jgi:periplasmic protein TonB
MTEAGFFEPRKISPTSLTIVIALHAAALTALALSKTEIIRDPFNQTEVTLIPEPIDPEPVVEPPKPQVPVQNVPATATIDDPIVDWNREADPIPPGPLPAAGAAGTGTAVTPEPPEPQPLPDPVRVEARFDPRFADRLQPPYPASEQRAEREGLVKVRVLIGVDGKVKAAEALSSASPAFWEATQRHALRHWRFKPAMLDGKPVESWKVMTVRFEMTA